MSTEAVHSGSAKWAGLTAVAGRWLVAAPFDAPALLIYDADAADVSGADTEGVYSGSSKWQGIAAVGQRAFAAPMDATAMLVFDFASSSAFGVPAEQSASTSRKWSGVAAVAESAMALAVTFEVRRCRKPVNFGCFRFGC